MLESGSRHTTMGLEDPSATSLSRSSSDDSKVTSISGDDTGAVVHQFIILIVFSTRFRMDCSSEVNSAKIMDELLLSSLTQHHIERCREKKVQIKINVKKRSRVPPQLFLPGCMYIFAGKLTKKTATLSSSSN